MGSQPRALPKRDYLPGIWMAAFLGLFLTNGIFALGWHGGDLLLPVAFVGGVSVATALLCQAGQRRAVPWFVFLPVAFLAGWRTLSFTGHPSLRGALDMASLLCGMAAFVAAASIGKPGRGWEAYLLALVAAALPTAALAGLGLVFPWFVTYDWRSQSSMGNPNLLSAALAPLAVFALGPLVWRSTPRVCLAGILSCALLLLAIYAARSRGGMVAFVLSASWLALAIDWTVSPRVRRGIGLGVLLGVLAVALYASRPFVPDQADRVIIDEVRFRGWSVALRMLARRPLTGVGVGRFVDEALPYPGPDETQACHAHNLYLQYGAETGVPGVVGLLAFLLGLGIAVRGAWHQADTEGRAFLAVVTAAMLAMLVHAVVDYVLWSPACGVLFWTVAGILAGGWCPVPRSADP